MLGIGHRGPLKVCPFLLQYSPKTRCQSLQCSLDPQINSRLLNCPHMSPPQISHLPLDSHTPATSFGSANESGRHALTQGFGLFCFLFSNHLPCPCLQQGCAPLHTHLAEAHSPLFPASCPTSSPGVRQGSEPRVRLLGLEPLPFCLPAA